MPAEGRFDFDAAQRRERGKRWLARCRQALAEARPASGSERLGETDETGNPDPDPDEEF